MLAMRDDALMKFDPTKYTLFSPAPAGTMPMGSLWCNTQHVSTVNALETDKSLPSEIGSMNCSQDSPNPHIWRRLFGLMTVPLYLTSPNPDGKLNLDANGNVAQNGSFEVEFEVNIPMAATKTPGTPIANGHGLLGDKTEGHNGYLAEIDDAGNFVSIAVDLVGFDQDDYMQVANDLSSDPTSIKDEFSRQHQGAINQLLAMRLMTELAKDPMTFYNSQPTIDPSKHYYRGDSQGGIMGSVYMAISTDVTRGVLGEPGVPYSLLLNRSKDFAPFFTILESIFATGRDIQMFMGMLQMCWDRTEPDGYVPYISSNTLPNTPSHQVLIHDNIGDYQVTPLGAHILARAVGASNLSPVNRDLYGIPNAPSPIAGNAIVEWNWGLTPAPTTDTPPFDLCPQTSACMMASDCAADGKGYTNCSSDSKHCEPPKCGDPHDQLRIQPASIQQEVQFFTTGMVVGTCGTGPCVGTFM
jgi:hypothetical protein